MSILRPDTIQRLYFAPHQVAKALSVETSALRFWEDEFGLQVHRSRHNKRRYTVTDVGRFATIARLVKWFHIPAAKLLMDEGRADGVLDILEPGARESEGTPMMIA